MYGRCKKQQQAARSLYLFLDEAQMPRNVGALNFKKCAFAIRQMRMVSAVAQSEVERECGNFENFLNNPIQVNLYIQSDILLYTFKRRWCFEKIF